MQRVAAEGVTVVDDGTLPGRRGSINIDDEGTPSRRNTLIENGVLVGYLQDKLNAELMGMEATGNGRRESYAHLPMPRMTNTFMLAGEDDPQDIIRSVKKGIYALDQVRDFTTSYQNAGGRRSLSDYYHARYDSAVLRTSLKKSITFANHNLAVDHSFGEMHLVMCRNVLIYFNKELQSRVLRIMAESLVHGGFLCLGSKESLDHSSVASDFEEVDAQAKIYKKVEAA